MEQYQYDELAALIERLVEVSGYPFNEKNSQFLKVDLLERAIEIWRIKNKHLDNSIPIEKFIQGSFSVNYDCVHLSAQTKVTGSGAATPSIRLQPKLLMFLLLYYRDSYAVYDIIHNFIDKIWSKLDLLDFKKTRTGVTRCFTNTRFAANTLRDYGFLKFTRKEAYKTWVLSLTGFLVASKVLEDGNWNIAEYKKEYASFGLHPNCIDKPSNL